MMVRNSTDLPLPDAADHAQDLAGTDVERQMVEHDLVAEADHEIAHGDDRLLPATLHHIPIEAKKMANRPSSTITRKIDFTTDAVVLQPERLGAALDLQPLGAGHHPDHQPHERRLDHAHLEMGHRDRFRAAAR